MCSRLRLTLGQQLMLLVIALVLAVQITNVIVVRVSDVQTTWTSQDQQLLTTTGRSFQGLLSIPPDQRARFADGLSNLEIVYDWGSESPRRASEQRRTVIEEEALAIYQAAGLPIDVVVLTYRQVGTPAGSFSRPARTGLLSERPAILNLGAPRRFILFDNFAAERRLWWIDNEGVESDYSLPDLFLARPPAEVQRLSLRHAETGLWLNAHQFRRLPPVNAAYTKLVASSIASVLLAIIVLLIGRQVMRPLNRLSREAERLARGEAPAPLIIEGPRDTREIISSFNLMNARVTQSINYQIGLLRSLGHDLKGPLSGIRGLVSSVGPDTTRHQIQTRLDRVQSIVDSIMSFSRAVMRDGDFQKVDLTQLAEVAVDDRAELGDDVQLTTDAPIMIMCRVNAIQRCLANLIENACKYGHEARVAVCIDGQDAVVTIDDAGPGIPEKDLTQVFEPFRRLASDTHGTGLGLAIVKSIVVDQGGTIELSNRPAGGLRAELRLPIEREV